MNITRLFLTRAILVMACCLFSCRAYASGDASRGGFVEGYYRFDNAIRRFLMGGMDTTYVTIPSTSFEVPVIGKIYGYNTSIAPEDKRLQLSSGSLFEVGAGIGYHGLDAVYTQAVGKSLNFNFQFDYYDNYWGLGIDISRIDYSSLQMDMLTGVHSMIPMDREMQSRAILLEGYYAVFGNRYSLPAALYGNYIQKKSAGSPVISFWYEHRDYFAFSDRALMVMSGRKKLDEGALTVGYGYNFAIAGGRFLINASAGVGLLIPSWGLSSTGRLHFMAWINEHCRVFANVTNFYQRSWSSYDLRLEDNTWRGSVGIAYCFGKNPRYGIQ